jgi:mRNA interferase MazF
MKQGELWYADLNQVVGSEQSGFRPMLVISGNLLNTYLNVVICCPLTAKIKNFKGNVILNPTRDNNLKNPSEVLTFHIRSISKDRFVKKIGQVSKEELRLVKKCLDEILTY